MSHLIWFCYTLSYHKIWIFVYLDFCIACSRQSVHQHGWPSVLPPAYHMLKAVGAPAWLTISTPTRISHAQGSQCTSMADHLTISTPTRISHAQGSQCTSMADHQYSHPHITCSRQSVHQHGWPSVFPPAYHMLKAVSAPAWLTISTPTRISHAQGSQCTSMADHQYSHQHITCSRQSVHQHGWPSVLQPAYHMLKAVSAPAWLTISTPTHISHAQGSQCTSMADHQYSHPHITCSRQSVHQHGWPSVLPPAYHMLKAVGAPAWLTISTPTRISHAQGSRCTSMADHQYSHPHITCSRQSVHQHGWPSGLPPAYHMLKAVSAPAWLTISTPTRISHAQGSQCPSMADHQYSHPHITCSRQSVHQHGWPSVLPPAYHMLKAVSAPVWLTISTPTSISHAQGSRCTSMADHQYSHPHITCSRQSVHQHGWPSVLPPAYHMLKAVSAPAWLTISTPTRISHAQGSQCTSMADHQYSHPHITCSRQSMHQHGWPSVLPPAYHMLKAVSAPAWLTISTPPAYATVQSTLQNLWYWEAIINKLINILKNKNKIYIPLPWQIELWWKEIHAYWGQRVIQPEEVAALSKAVISD